MLERSDRMTAVTFENAMIAIVQQDDIASLGTAQALNDRLGRLRLPIPRRERPHHDWRIAALANNPFELRAAEPVGRTHPAWAPANGPVKRFVATVELFGDATRGKKRQCRMRIGVIADRVTTLGNFLCERRESTHVPADQEKRRSGAVPVKQIEQKRSDRRVRTIIKRQSERRPVAGMANRAAEKLCRGGRGRPSKNSAGDACAARREQCWKRFHTDRDFRMCS
jgi:hypothetical protein